mmetsp:Transcript_30665/g.94936  ORF Transcript_30665/g.94936 Transcript_30665/m.94936 type:complete len:239 (-) Transcript_30665:29-745(-)
MRPSSGNGSSAATSNESAPAAPASIKPPGAGQRSEDVKYVRFRDVVDVQALEGFYGMAGFPWELLVCRSGDDNEYAAADSKAAKKIVLANAAAAELCLNARALKLRVVHAGVVAFSRTSDSAAGEVDYRLSQDGIDLLLPFLNKRKVTCSRSEFELLLNGGAHSFAAFSPAVAAALTAMSVGSVVFALEGVEEAPPAVVTWRGMGGFVTVFAGKEDLVVLRSRVAAVVPALPEALPEA